MLVFVSYAPWTADRAIEKLRPRNFDRGDHDRLVRSGKLHFIADRRSDQRSCERGSEGNSVCGRFALVMANQVENIWPAIAHERNARSERNLSPISKRSEFRACKPLAPVAGVAKNRLAILFGQRAFQASFQLLVACPDQLKTARRDQVRPRRDRQLEPRLEMLLIALPAEGNAHDRDAIADMASIIARASQKSAVRRANWWEFQFCVLGLP